MDGDQVAQGQDLLPHGRPPRRARARGRPARPRPLHLHLAPRPGGDPVGDEPEEVAKLGLPANADFNADGILSIAELDAYVSQNLKAIARVFPEIVVKSRGRTARRQAEGPGRETRATPLLQSFGSSFPLVPLRLASRTGIRERRGSRDRLECP